jgi:hypothetical protein
MRSVLIGWLLSSTLIGQEQIRPVVPPQTFLAESSASAAADAGDYVYISGQGPVALMAVCRRLLANRRTRCSITLRQSSRGCRLINAARRLHGLSRRLSKYAEMNVFGEYFAKKTCRLAQ